MIRFVFFKMLMLGGMFVIGFVLMGFEMLGSRYLNPYFGGSITTWASLISVVLLSMMLGYFIGGVFVDKSPQAGIIVGCTFVAGLVLLSLPLLADNLIRTALVALGDRFWGGLFASLGLLSAPVILLSACSPCAVRLLLTDLKDGGTITGLVYAVSTFGNVAGTLVTTFVLIPHFGTRAITGAFGIVLIVLSLLFYILRNLAARNRLACAEQ